MIGSNRRVAREGCAELLRPEFEKSQGTTTHESFVFPVRHAHGMRRDAMTDEPSHVFRSASPPAPSILSRSEPHCCTGRARRTCSALKTACKKFFAVRRTCGKTSAQGGGKAVWLTPSTGLGSWVLGLPGRLGLGSWSQPEDWVLGLGSWGRRRPD